MPVPVSCMGQGTLGCAAWSLRDPPQAAGEPLRRSTPNQNASSLPFDMSPLMSGKGFQAIPAATSCTLGPVLHLPFCRSIRPAWARIDACPWLGQPVLQWKLLS